MSLATPDRIRSLQRKLYRKAKADGSFAVCPTVKPVGKPDAGNRHVRFDERGRETGRCRMAQATAPFLDSTNEAGPGLILAMIAPHGPGCCFRQGLVGILAERFRISS